MGESVFFRETHFEYIYIIRDLHSEEAQEKSNIYICITSWQQKIPKSCACLL